MNTETMVGQADSALTLRQMFALWLPLAASIIMMVLEPSIINIGLGRTLNPELALAAYGVAFGLALLVEAPILMLLDASVAKSDSAESFAVVRRFTLSLGVVVTALGLLVSFTPLYDIIVLDLMNIPSSVAVRARPTMQLLSIWPFPVAWRRAHQGLLIRSGHTGVISLATMVRLVSLSSALVGGLALFPDRGSMVAGVAMDISVIVEALVITVAARPVLRKLASDPAPPVGPRLTFATLWRFYLPLAITTLLRQTTRPMLNAGIAATALARDSLATWSVVWAFVVLVSGPGWSLQQFTTAMASGKEAYEQVKRFALGASLVFGLLLALVAFTPLYGAVLGGIYNLSPALQILGRPAVQFLVALPILMGVQSLLRGVLIRTGKTGTVQSAMTINVLVLGATMALGVRAYPQAGVTLAAVATIAGALAELGWLYWRKAQ